MFSLGGGCLGGFVQGVFVRGFMSGGFCPDTNADITLTGNHSPRADPGATKVFVQRATPGTKFFVKIPTADTKFKVELVVLK